MKAPDRIVVGIIKSAHGLEGAVRVRVLSDDQSRFSVGSFVIVGDTPLRIASVSGTCAEPIIRFEGYHSRESVKPLLRMEMQIPYGISSELESGEFYHFQVIGLKVYGNASEKYLGEVIRVERYPSCDAIVLDNGTEIPFLRDFISEVDLGKGRIIVCRLMENMNLDN